MTGSPTRFARLAPGGRLLVIGFTGGDIPTIKVNRLLLNNVDAVGVGWGAWSLTHPGYLLEQWAELEPLLASGKVSAPRAGGLSTRARRGRDRLAGGPDGQGQGRRQAALTSGQMKRPPERSLRGSLFGSGNKCPGSGSLGVTAEEADGRDRRDDPDDAPQHEREDE